MRALIVAAALLATAAPAWSQSYPRNRQINAPVAGVLCQCNAAVIVVRGRARSSAGRTALRSGDVGNCVIGLNSNAQIARKAM
jgi:hypothetical protein